jgi:hypothetical protein
MVASSAAGTSIVEFWQQEAAAVEARSAEWNGVVALLSRTLTEVASASQDSLGRLQRVESELVAAQHVKDLRLLRGRLAECLETVRQEARARRNESSQLVARLGEAVERGASGAANTDGVSAEDKLLERSVEDLAAGSAETYAAVMVFDHLKTLVSRFGPRAAHKVAAFGTAQTAKEVPGVLFAGVWKMGATVLLLEGAPGLEHVERAVRGAARLNRTMTLELGSRDVLVHVAYGRWRLFPLAGRRAADAMAEMENFVNG